MTNTHGRVRVIRLVTLSGGLQGGDTLVGVRIWGVQNHVHMGFQLYGWGRCPLPLCHSRTIHVVCKNQVSVIGCFPQISCFLARVPYRSPLRLSVVRAAWWGCALGLPGSLWPHFYYHKSINSQIFECLLSIPHEPSLGPSVVFSGKHLWTLPPCSLRPRMRGTLEQPADDSVMHRDERC